MVSTYFLVVLISFVITVHSEVSLSLPNVAVLSIESKKSTLECQKIPVKTGFFDFSDSICHQSRTPSDLKTLFEEKFGICPCKEPHERIAKLVGDRSIDWESFKSEILQVPEEFPEYQGYLLVEELTPECSENGKLHVRVCFRSNCTRTFGRPQTFQSGGDVIYQYETIQGTVSTTNCTFSNGYARCWANHPILFFRKNRTSVSNFAHLKRSSNSFSIISLVVIVAILIIIGLVLIQKRSLPNQSSMVPVEPVKVVERRNAIVFDI